MILTHGSDPNQVALTFDDGPNLVHTYELLAILREHKAKATFFMIGKWIEQLKGVVRAVAGAGHEIGNHTYNHPSLPSLLYGGIGAEIATCQGILDNQFEHRSEAKLFRPPYGHISELVERTAANMGLATVLWSQLSGDWAAKSPEEILEKVNLDTDKGEIVLLHDGGPEKLGADRSNTVKAVEMILQKWPNKQYVTVSELTI